MTKNKDMDFLLDRYPMNIIGAWGCNYNGKTYQPCCRKCRSFKVKRLKGPFELKGETFGFSCEECKRPVHLGLKEIKLGFWKGVRE